MLERNIAGITIHQERQAFHFNEIQPQVLKYIQDRDFNPTQLIQDYTVLVRSLAHPDTPFQTVQQVGFIGELIGTHFPQEIMPEIQLQQAWDTVAAEFSGNERIEIMKRSYIIAGQLTNHQEAHTLEFEQWVRGTSVTETSKPAVVKDEELGMADVVIRHTATGDLSGLSQDIIHSLSAMSLVQVIKQVGQSDKPSDLLYYPPEYQFTFTSADQTDIIRVIYYSLTDSIKSASISLRKGEPHKDPIRDYTQNNLISIFPEVDISSMIRHHIDRRMGVIPLTAYTVLDNFLCSLINGQGNDEITSA